MLNYWVTVTGEDGPWERATLNAPGFDERLPGKIHLKIFNITTARLRSGVSKIGRTSWALFPLKVYR